MILKNKEYFAKRFKELNATDSKPKQAINAKVENDDWRLR